MKNKNVVQFYFEDLISRTTAKFINNRLIGITTTNIYNIPKELKDTAAETLKEIQKIDLKDDKNTLELLKYEENGLSYIDFYVTKNK